MPSAEEPLELTDMLTDDPEPAMTEPAAERPPFEPPVHFSWEDGPLHDDEDAIAAARDRAR